MEATRPTRAIVAKVVFALALAAIHLAAISLDFTLSNNWRSSTTIAFPFFLAIFHCDIALFCISISRRPRFPWLSVALAFIISGLTAAAILYSWQYPGAPWVNSSKLFTESLQGQCIITALLNLPVLTISAWLIARRERRDWHWLAFALLLTASVVNCGLSSTTNDFVMTRSRAWWLDLYQFIFYHTLFAWALSGTAVVLCAWIMSYPRRWFHFGWALLLLLSLEIPVLVFRAAVLLNPRIFYGYGFRGNVNSYRAMVEPFKWQMFWEFNIPFIAAFAGLFLAPFFLTSNRASQPMISPFAPNDLAISLSTDERRQRFWRLTGFALLLSALNLLSGLALHLMRVDSHDEHGSQGILIELLFLAPLGLWAAQTGASALFLQSKVWNIWKRLLLVLVWAELSMLAFWGQIALSNSIRWMPSDYVGEVLHVFTGAILLAGFGGLLNTFRNERVDAPELESKVPLSQKSKWFSLSMADIICLVTASAALVYPFSVIFTLELWLSPFVVCFSFVGTAGWPLAASGLCYFTLRAWLTSEKNDYWNLAAAAICLLACCGYDYPALHQFAEEYFFGVRHSLRFTALPALFVGVAVTAIGLSRCKFQVVQKSSIPILAPAPNPAPEAPSRPVIFLGAKPEPAASQPKSPWD